MSYHPENQILVTVGVSEAMDIALRAVINPGDKIMYHQPCYVSYSPSITMSHGIGVPINTCAENEFSITCEDIAAAWEPGCKVIVLNFPTNPTGGIVEREELLKIAKFAQEKDLLVISDEIYAELTYEKTHTSIASLPGMAERDDFPPWLFQSLCNDWIPNWLCGGPSCPHRCHDENPPILHDVCPYSQPRGRD